MNTLSHIVGSTPQTIALVTIGAVLLLLAGINEFFTKRSAIVPPRLFRVSPCLLNKSISNDILDSYNGYYPCHRLSPCNSFLCGIILSSTVLPGSRCKCHRRWYPVRTITQFIPPIINLVIQNAAILTWFSYALSLFWVACLQIWNLSTLYVGSICSYGTRLRTHDSA